MILIVALLFILLTIICTIMGNGDIIIGLLVAIALITLFGALDILKEHLNKF